MNFVEIKKLRRVFDVSKPWLNRVIEGRAARHQGRASKYSLAMCSDNSFIYSACEAEVVGVEDQLFHLRAACLRGDEMISRRYR